MDLFKKMNNNEATSWDWNCPRYVKRVKGDTQKLHRLSRRRLKKKLEKVKKYCQDGLEFYKLMNKGEYPRQYQDDFTQDCVRVELEQVYNDLLEILEWW